MYALFNISGRVAVLIPLESLQPRESEGSFVVWVQLCVFWECTELQEERPFESWKMVFCEVCNLFKVCKYVHHHKIQVNQLDAANSPVYYLTFIYSSIFFGRPHAHHQELNNCSSSLWFYRWSVVIAVLLVVVGPARPRPKALLSLVQRSPTDCGVSLCVI
jgi:hypothetical protein